MNDIEINFAIQRLLPHYILYNNIDEFKVIRCLFSYYHSNRHQSLDFDALASTLPNYNRPRRNQKSTDIHWLLALFKHNFEDLANDDIKYELIRKWLGFAIYLSVLSHIHLNPVQAKNILKKFKIYGYTQTADYQWFWDHEFFQTIVPVSRPEFDPQYLQALIDELNERAEILANALWKQTDNSNYKKRARQIEQINQIIEWAYYPERKNKRSNREDKEQAGTSDDSSSKPDKPDKIKDKPWQNPKAEPIPINVQPNLYGFFNANNVSDPSDNNTLELLPFCEGPFLYKEKVSVEELVDAYNADYLFSYPQPNLSKRTAPLHNYDESVQQTYMAAHDFELATNIRYLSKTSCQAVFNHLVTYSEQPVAALLLFSLITSLPIKTLLTPEFFSKSSLLEYDNEQIFMMHRLGVSDRTETRTSCFENKSDLIYLPLPVDLTSKLAKVDAAELTMESIKEFIKAMKSQLEIVYLTDTRISKILHMYIRRFTPLGNRHYADLICRTPASIAPAIYYSSHPNDDIICVYKEGLTLLSAGSTYDLRYFDKPTPNFSTGSMQVLNIEHVKNLILELTLWVSDSKTASELFNRYSIYTWYAICLLTGIRANNGIPGSVNHIDEEMGWLIVDDKPNRSSKTDRLIPLCASARQLIIDYKKFLRTFRVTFIENRELFNLIGKTLDNNNESTIINLLESTHQLNPIKRGDITKATPHELDIDPYWVRHFVRTQLEKLNTPIPLINEIIGHERRDQEALNKYSSITKQQIYQVGPTLEIIAQAIGIKSLATTVEEHLGQLRSA